MVVGLLVLTFAPQTPKIDFGIAEAVLAFDLCILIRASCYDAWCSKLHMGCRLRQLQLQCNQSGLGACSKHTKQSNEHQPVPMEFNSISAT